MKEAETPVNIVILDACRNDPFSRRFRGQSGHGLAAVTAPTGTFIAYATAPGDVASDGDGRNGLYTTEVVRAMSLPGLKIEEVFKQVRSGVLKASSRQQVPWESTSLTGEFYFTTPKAEPPPPPAVDREAMYWQSIAGSSRAGDFQSYLAAYPAGTFAGLARERLATFQERLAKPAPPPVIASRTPTGVLRVHVQPAGASVQIDGTEYGNGPDVLARLPAGRHSIVVSKSDLGSTSRDIAVTDGSAADVTMALEENPPERVQHRGGRFMLPPP